MFISVLHQLRHVEANSGSGMSLSGMNGLEAAQVVVGGSVTVRVCWPHPRSCHLPCVALRRLEAGSRPGRHVCGRCERRLLPPVSVSCAGVKKATAHNNLAVVST